jgi:xylulokinase
MLFDVAGTAAVLAGCTANFLADEGHRALLTMRSVIPGLWHPLAYIAGGGLALRWYRDQFYNTCRGQPLPLDEELYAEICALALTAPAGSDGLFFSPHLGGRICPAAPEMRGAWIGFSWGHSQAHFSRALLESVALEYAWYLKIMKENLPEIKLVEARAIGGGARSPAWVRIKASVLGVPYRRLQRSEFGTWGAALVAGKAVGLFEDLAHVAEVQALPERDVILPVAEEQNVYQELVEKYVWFQNQLQLIQKNLRK